MMTTIRSKLSRIKWHAGLHIRDLALQLNGSYRNKQSVSFCTPVKKTIGALETKRSKNLEDNQDYPFLEIDIFNYACPNPDTERWVKRN